MHVHRLSRKCWPEPRRLLSGSRSRSSSGRALRARLVASTIWRTARAKTAQAEADHALLEKREGAVISAERLHKSAVEEVKSQQRATEMHAREVEKMAMALMGNMSMFPCCACDGG